MTVLVRGGSDEWREPAGRGYANEAALQQLIHDHPTLIPGVVGDAIACREFSSGVGPADVVILDSEGSLTIVECKLASNAEVRRKIIGQVLDYASRMWRMPADEFEQAWMRADAHSESPFTSLGDSDGALRALLHDNLADARFNLVLAVDAINDDLRRIVEYLNTITRPSTGVVLVEFTRYEDSGMEMLMPRTYGMELVEAKNERGEQGSRPQWSISQYQDWCDDHDPSHARTVRDFILTLQAAEFRIEGGRARTPSLNCGPDIPGIGRVWPLALFTDLRDGAVIQIRFGTLKNHPDLARAFTQAVCAVPGFPLTAEEVTAAHFAKRPNIPLRSLSPEAAQTLARAVTRVENG